MLTLRASIVRDMRQPLLEIVPKPERICLFEAHSSAAYQQKNH
jgi:hypothetical protein